MVASPSLLIRFLRDARHSLESGSPIILPFFHFAGTENDPKLRGEEQGYRVVVGFETETNFGAQQGHFSIYILWAE